MSINSGGADSRNVVNTIIWPFLKKSKLIKKGFEDAGINDAQAEDPFEDPFKACSAIF